MAIEFFKDEFKDNSPIVFSCHSWMLFPKNNQILPENSNILKFIQDYDVLFSENTFDDIWRIFNVFYDNNTENFGYLPENTSLQKAYKNFLLCAGKPATSYGLYIYKK